VGGQFDGLTEGQGHRLLMRRHMADLPARQPHFNHPVGHQKEAEKGRPSGFRQGKICAHCFESIEKM
jgi:hypothetical protein